MINHIKVNLNDYAAEEAPLTGITNKVINNIVTTTRHPNIKAFVAFQPLKELFNLAIYTLYDHLKMEVK